ncbi:methylated-DNA--[protein]-cysteine S-methyltransferase [bacterium]|nr:MAG: methylated-DNA--[protein]-cysteine S-methyltransferase [bacterium]
MRCREVVACWDDMRSGAEPRREHVLAHLRACADCQAAYAEFEGVAYCLSCLPVAPPPQSLVPRIMAHIREQCEQLHVHESVSVAIYQAPIGRLLVAYRDAGITAIRVDRGEELHELVAALERRIHAVALPLQQHVPAWVRQGLEAFFSGRSDVSVPLDLAYLTEFERAVFEAAARIPRGEVRSYGWLASEVGRPNAARAVGQALANNPIPLLIPCHRVIDCKGRLHRYVYGVELKRRLLDLEGYQQEETRAGMRTS